MVFNPSNNTLPKNVLNNEMKIRSKIQKIQLKKIKQKEISRYTDKYDDNYNDNDTVFDKLLLYELFPKELDRYHSEKPSVDMCVINEADVDFIKNEDETITTENEQDDYDEDDCLPSGEIIDEPTL